MTFTVSNKTLGDALNLLIKVVSSKNVLPILDNFIFTVKGEELTLTAADTENMMTARISLTEASGEGDFAVNAKSMMDAVKNIADIPLTFTLDENNMNVKVAWLNGMFTLPTDNTNEFPNIGDIKADALTFDIPENILQENIARTVFATAQNELRPVMNGIFFDLTAESLNIVASDGHQLVRNKVLNIKGEDTNIGSFILPKKPAHILKNTLRKTDGTVSIKADDQRVEVVTETFTLNCRLIEGRYPNYNSVIPKSNPNILTADRASLIGALKRINPFANTNSCLVRVHVEPGTLQLEAEDYDFSKKATEQLACEYEGTTFTIGFKGTSFIEILDNIKSTEIQMQLADPTRAALILPAEQPEEQEILMLQMPMLIND